MTSENEKEYKGIKAMKTGQSFEHYYKTFVEMFELSTDLDPGKIVPNLLLHGIRPNYSDLYDSVVAECPKFIWTKEKDAAFDHPNDEIKNLIRSKHPLE